MEDVRKIAKRALGKDSVLVFSAEADFTEDESPEEYIVFHLISSVYTAYANGKPIRQKDSIDVDYYSKTQDKKVIREPQIISLLESIGFRVSERFSDDGSGRNEKGYFFSTANFTIERVIANG
jgi:hypothetical protein